jgi:DNA repair ATPase RecN
MAFDVERVRAAVARARQLLDEADHTRVGGALGPAKSTVAAVVRRTTWHQREAVAALAEGLDVLTAVSAELAQTRAHLEAVSEGLARFEERITALEKRAARTEAMVATLATDLHDLRGSTAAHTENGGGARA